MKARFGPFQLDTEIPELRRDGEVVRIEPKVFDILAYLVEHRDRIVSKDELIEAVWDGRIVSDAAVTSRMNLVRQAVGDSGQDQATIRTIPKRGFRFVADVEPEEPAGMSAEGAQPSDLVDTEASILVLPFTDLSPDESNFLAEGLTEDLIVALARYNDVRVVSINTANKLKERQSRLKSPLADVSTSYLVNGTVQVRGDRVRVSVQLSERATGASIFTERFDRDVSDFFELQDEIVTSLAGCLPWRVYADAGRRLSSAKAPRLTSYQAFVRANFEIGVHRDIHQAEKDYRTIIASDPGFGPARGALAFLLGYKVFFTGQQTQAEIDESLTQARAAIRLSSDNERVLAKCAMVFQFAEQFKVARRLAEQAIHINPNSTDCTHFMAAILTASGEPELAMALHQRTMSLDPLFPEEHYEGMIEALFLLGRYDEALELVDRWSNPPCHNFAYGAVCTALAGDEARAAAFAKAFAERRPAGYSNATFVSALLRYHERSEDREHWLRGFEAANIPEMDIVRQSGIAGEHSRT
jgi:DNA-binding winged helix-turn-helix (wHTH) protein